MGRPRLLTKTDLETILKPMRKWDRWKVLEIAKLVDHIKALEELTSQAFKSAQPDLFKKAEAILRPTQYKEFTPPVTHQEKFPLAKRIKLMVDTNETDSDAWRLMLKYNGLTHEQALEIIKDENPL